MKPRPLHRWKSFWFGVLVLVFLGWAWWVSYSYTTSGNVGRVVMAQGNGYVQVGRGWEWLPPFFYDHQPMPRGMFVFDVPPMPFFASSEEKGPPLPVDHVKPSFEDAMRWSFAGAPKDCWALFLPHWLLVAVFTMAWGAMLGWRWRRLRRLAGGESEQ